MKLIGAILQEWLRHLEVDWLEQHCSLCKLEVTMPQDNRPTIRMGSTIALVRATFKKLPEVTLLRKPFATWDGIKDGIAALQDLGAYLVTAEGQMARTINLDKQVHHQTIVMGHNRVPDLALSPLALLLIRGGARIAHFVLNFYKVEIKAWPSVLGALRDRDGRRAENWTRMRIAHFWHGDQIAGLKNRIVLSGQALS